MVQRVLHFVTRSWTEHMALLWIWNIMVVLHVGMGVAVLAGGERRFSIPSYQPLIDMSDGRTWLWGAWVLCAGLLMTMPARWPQIVGLWLGMCWNIIWSALFSVAMVQYPTASATAAVAYIGFAMLDAALLTARVIERGKG